MSYSVFFIVLVLLLLLLVSILRIDIAIQYRRNNKSDYFAISLYLLSGLIKYKHEIPLTYQKRANPSPRRFGETFKYFTNIYKKNIKKKLVIKDLKLNVKIGTGDAAYTGIASGLIWMFVGIIIAFIFKNFIVLNKNIKVKQNYFQKILYIDLLCIFSINIANIIFIGLKVLLYSIKTKQKTE